MENFYEGSEALFRGRIYPPFDLSVAYNAPPADSV